MKTNVFCCLNTAPDLYGRPRYIRVKLTLDPSITDSVGLYIFPGSEHHSCNHQPTQISPKVYKQHFGRRSYAVNGEAVDLSDGPLSS